MPKKQMPKGMPPKGMHKMGNMMMKDKDMPMMSKGKVKRKK